MKLTTKIRSVTENRAELLGKGEITQSHTTEGAGRKFREHIHTTSGGVDIVASDRVKKRKRANAPLAAKAGNHFAIQSQWADRRLSSSAKLTSAQTTANQTLKAFCSADCPQARARTVNGPRFLLKSCSLGDYAPCCHRPTPPAPPGLGGPLSAPGRRATRVIGSLGNGAR